MSDFPPGNSPGRRRRRLAIGSLGLLLVAIAGLPLISRTGTSHRRWPDPNGYIELAEAGAMIRGQLPGNGDLTKADPAAIRLYANSNKSVLDRVRIALAHESIAPLVDSQDGLSEQFERAVRIKSAAWLLRAEGLVSEADGRFADALRSYRDMLEVGQVVGQGGMLTDARLGWFLQKFGIAGLRRVRDRISADDSRRLIRDVECCDDRLVDPGAVLDRWERWYRGAFPSHQRFLMWWNGIEAAERTSQMSQAVKARADAARSLRFLAVELAIHAHHLENATWPRSIGELVPAYLARAPLDPTTGRPLEYPANPQGELTDDLGSIARPDGEVGHRP